MCGHEVVPPGRSAEERLADLMNSRLGVDVTPGAVAKFVLNNWSLVTAYAHAIHQRAQFAAETNVYGTEEWRSSQYEKNKFLPPITGTLDMKIDLDMLK